MPVRENGKLVKRQYEVDFVVNTGLRKIYIQSAFSISDAEKHEQETFSLRKTGDFYRKIVVTSGYQRPLEDKNGIIIVGVIPFLLTPSIILGDSK